MNGHARIRAQSEIARIIMGQLLEAGHVDSDVIAIWRAPDAKLSAAARWNDAKSFRYREANDSRNFAGGTWLGDRRGNHSIYGVATQLLRIGNDIRSSEQSFEPGSESGSDNQEWASCKAFRRVRISPQPLLRGKILPGFSEESGLKASWMRRIRSKSASLKSSGINSLFSMPTPCSPVRVPPTSTQYRMISSAALIAVSKS